ncbi:YkvA family protein [Aquipseudomonas guryensis]|jgi:uncharacterized membrane protein YkvA (DUF1232 family)|uniref:DUF1232 domain-containing protein n=1 Tax=Aquipseudomonas guryensis TaxID=2759165 RepID=A0A7W4DAV8_9GAMM|nr:DUF1232 domain-containing protein [Pseudomonas guryensis]MBB1519224.1 DUF1232 domain-containing protein [Pseudomonas guryensis]
MNVPAHLKRYLQAAQALLARGKLPGMLAAVLQKSASKGGRLGAVREDLRLLVGLCMAWWRGEYRAIGTQAFLSVVAALLYFLTPLDALPDWLLGIGLLDDLAVLAWVLRTWRGELDAYRAWRDVQAPAELLLIEQVPAQDRLPE